MTVRFFLYIRIVRHICYEIDHHTQQRKFLHHFKMSELPQLSEKLEKFLKLLVTCFLYIFMLFYCCTPHKGLRENLHSNGSDFHTHYTGKLAGG